ncbi:hypothetical protein DH2020_008148 [Rehmannia glutinosa]|uniref:Reverse transcriptase domain-containing protein n=1 Tax=Rehmannia glutinosa TaxID=99300 RepID=A0ABR0U064_REHGL
MNRPVARYVLWDTMREIAISMEGLPWLVSGDFNIFLHDHERVGGTTNRWDEMLDFAYMIADCELFDAGCEGPIFTWARGGLQERLDRALYNEHWADARIFGARKQLLSGQSRRSATLSFSTVLLSRSGVVLDPLIDDDGVTITQDSEIRKSVVQFFQSLLTSDLEYLTTPVDELFPRLPDSVDLDGLCAMSTAQEVRVAVFGIDPSSISGPDGFSSLFFQHCWDFAKTDVEDAVVDFFSGNLMPSTFTATSIVLIPKVPHPRKWTEFRPISLCDVTNKIISKIMNARLVSILPLIVSPNQSGFTPGRVISDNILLAQELIHDISLATEFPNVVMKLDMAKAYDRVGFLVYIYDSHGLPRSVD